MRSPRVEEGDLRIQFRLPSLRCPGKCGERVSALSPLQRCPGIGGVTVGIPQAWYRVTGAVYWPSYIAWYGLVQLGHYLRRGDEANLNAFLKQVSWPEQNAVWRSDGAVVWPMNFDYPNGAMVLKAPWISAYTQGLVISALVRAWRLTNRPALRELLKSSAKVFELDVKDSGVRLYVSALHWMWKVETGRRHGRAIGPDYTEVRFENLVLHPEEALAKVSAFIGENLDYERIRRAKIGVISVPNTSFSEEWKSGSFSPVGRWKRQLSDDQVTQLEGLIGELLAELGYPLSRAESTTLGFRLRTMRSMYPVFYQLKEWLKTATPLGRFVNMNRLQIDQNEDSRDVEEGVTARESEGLLSSTSSGISETRM
jgi:D-glucuronyl C5-epimerase C-terminus